MSFLQFNKAELVNLSYSLKREIISASKSGAYCNTTIVACNTRRYHGLLAVSLDRFEGKYLLLSALDESLVMQGKQFNLGIHRYGDIYEPRGHKYVIDFQADPIPKITYKVGEIVFAKSILLSPDSDQVFVKYELLHAPSPVTLLVKPFLAFRNIHVLTHANPEADPTAVPCSGGASFRLYEGFPDLYIQASSTAAKFTPHPDWYMGVTYSDEARRGFECVEDLMVPGAFELKMKAGDSVVFSASLEKAVPGSLKRKYASIAAKTPEIQNFSDQLRRCADSLVVIQSGKKKINSGLSWMSTGLLRETLMALPGLTLHAGRPEEFEEILDNLIEDDKERLFRRTTQVEAPLCVALVLQEYIGSGADSQKVWRNTGLLSRGFLKAIFPGEGTRFQCSPMVCFGHRRTTLR
jgi:Glycogen debranching enzyme